MGKGRAFLKSKVVADFRQLAINRMVQHLQWWILIHSYIPYLAGLNVWDCIWYQSHRNDPLRDDELAASNDLLNHFRPIWLTKIWTSTTSSLHCPVDMSSNHVDSSLLDKHYAAVIRGWSREAGANYSGGVQQSIQQPPAV